jgi:hypothetical protein
LSGFDAKRARFNGAPKTTNPAADRRVAASRTTAATEPRRAVC